MGSRFSDSSSITPPPVHAPEAPVAGHGIDHTPPPLSDADGAHGKMCVDAMSEILAKRNGDDPAREKRQFADLLFDDPKKASPTDLNNAWKDHIRKEFARQNKPVDSADKWLTDFEITYDCH